MDTRRYTKRQVTWFRNQMPDWPWDAAEKPQRCWRQLAASNERDSCLTGH